MQRMSAEAVPSTTSPDGEAVSVGDVEEACRQESEAKAQVHMQQEEWKQHHQRRAQERVAWEQEREQEREQRRAKGLAEARQRMQHFEASNETCFAEDGDAKAVLGVTSGLTLPTAALPTVPTEDKINGLVGTYYSGPSRHQQIEAEVRKRRRVLLKKAGVDSRRRAITELRPTVEAEMGQMPRAGLVDGGGQSQHPSGQRMLSDGHRHGFIAAVTAAFAHHYPLTLKPQHFWLMIAQAVATHVDMNAEAVREHWVSHEGKKTLEVNCGEFQLGVANNWASVVSGKPDSFSAQVAANTVEGVAEALAPPFSNTSAAEDIAQKIVVMDICKNYFDYRCRTKCGFPQITLEGSVADWEVLREATEPLLGRCEPEFATKWSEALLPVLDKLLEARRGSVDSLFWNSMCKLGGKRGSGGCTWFNGWFNIFFPYIKRSPNRFCEPYSRERTYVLPVGNDVAAHTERVSPGPGCKSFGSGMSQAPVTWGYLGKEIPLEFNAGFTGAVQDPETLEITPQIGWFITHKVHVEDDMRGRQ